MMNTTFLSKLSQREKKLVGGGLAFLGVLILYLYGYAPMQERNIALSRQIERTEEALGTLERLFEERQYRATQIKAIESRLPAENKFSPLSYIEQVAVKNNVRNKITSIRAITSASQGVHRELPMEVKMEALSISAIVPFLAAFDESPYFMRMKRLSLRARQDDPGILDITFVLSFYETL